MNELSEKILEYRARHGISQEKFAEQAGLSVWTVMRLAKTGKCRQITRKKIEMLLDKDAK